MGLQYRKSFKLLPGVRLDLNTRGSTSVVIRLKCLQLRVNKRGLHGRFHFSKLGLSYRFGSGKKKKQRRK